MASKRSTKPAKQVTRRWHPLKKGDEVEVVAPGFRPTDAEVQSGVRFLESWGLIPRLPKDLFGNDVLSSNSDEKRLKHLSDAFTAKRSSAIWCLRGGYGAIRLIPGLLKLKRPAVVKPILGLSDVTTLQLFVEMKWGWPSLQTPLLDRLGRLIDPTTANGRPVPVADQVEELRHVLFGEASVVRHSGLKQIGDPRKVRGLVSRKSKTRVVHGAVTGGNLLTFASANGTAIHPVTDGKILYFEDIGERGYRVDRWLVQLVQAGIISKRTKAIVFGDFIEGNEQSGGSLVNEVLIRFAETSAMELGIPVFSGLQSGHGLNQRVVPLGTSAAFDLAHGELVIATGSSAAVSGRLS